LVTDSANLRKEARAALGDKLIVSGLDIEHVHQKNGHADGVLNAVADSWILAKTDFRVISQDSGFGKLAAFMSARRSTTVSLFPTRNLDVKGQRHPHLNVDCRLESAFTTLSELSNEWSLG